MRRMRILTLALGTLLLLSVVGTALGAELQPIDGHVGNYLLLEGSSASEPVTVQALFRVEEDKDLQVLWPVGLGESSDDPPGLLSLVWAEDHSGWFPVWAVQLQTNADLFGPGVSAKKGSGLLDGSKLINLHNARPQAGHLYQAEVSYDPANGLVSVGMSDLTEGTRLFTREVPIAPPAIDTLYPAVGAVGGRVAFESVTAAATGVPLGAPWELLVRSGDRYSRLALFRLTPDIELAVRLGAHGDYAGSFEVRVESETKTLTLAQLPGAAQAQESLVEFKATELPLGPLTLEMVYVDETEREWTLGSRSLLNVAATLEIRFADLTVEEDAIHGVMVISSADESVARLPVQLSAAIANPNAKEGTFSPVLITELEDVGQTAVQVPFSVPITTDDALFSLLFDVEFGVPVGIVMPHTTFHVLRVEAAN